MSIVNVKQIIVLYPGDTNPERLSTPANYSLSRLLMRLQEDATTPIYLLNKARRYERLGSIRFMPFSSSNLVRVAMKCALRRGTLIISQDRGYRRYAILLRHLLPASRLVVRLGGVYYGRGFLESPEYETWKWRDRRDLHAADMIVATADGTPVDRYMEVLGVSTRRYRKWLNGFPVISNARNYRRRNQVLCISRLSPEKGIDYVLRAFALALPRLRKEHTLVIVGDGPQMGDLKLQAAQLGIDSKVEFVGPSYDIEQHMYSASLLVSGFANNPVMEAIATDTPVITPDLGETRALYGEFPNVYVVDYPPGGCGPVDDQHMEPLSSRTAEVMVGLLNRDGRPKRRLGAARRDLTGWDQRIRQELELYETLFRKGRATPSDERTVLQRSDAKPSLACLPES
jgi:glycosyltransferase involved in cell wall biosynthesis